MTELRVCMLTTGFPRLQGDLFGTFVVELAQELAAGAAGPHCRHQPLPLGPRHHEPARGVAQTLGSVYENI